MEATAVMAVTVVTVVTVVITEVGMEVITEVGTEVIMGVTEVGTEMAGSQKDNCWPRSWISFPLNRFKFAHTSSSVLFSVIPFHKPSVVLVSFTLSSP